MYYAQEKLAYSEESKAKYRKAQLDILSVDNILSLVANVSITLGIANTGLPVLVVVLSPYFSWRIQQLRRPWSRRHQHTGRHPHGVLLDLQCPITLCLPSEPLISCWGHIYEKSAIEKWIREKSWDPFTRKRASIWHYRPTPEIRDLSRSPLPVV
ncbi:hypothetical protein BC938DRAFT_483415 [Jimgerdemannia flammicorona]|nr:hypothetical protein BC938DRAFT_483415 [Jimgerdemannia flammicorona]